MLLYLGRLRLTDVHLFCVGLVASALGLKVGNFLAPKVSQKVFERSILLFLAPNLHGFGPKANENPCLLDDSERKLHRHPCEVMLDSSLR